MTILIFPALLNLLCQLAAGLQAFHERHCRLGPAPYNLLQSILWVLLTVSQIDDIGLRSLLLALGYVSSQRNDDIGYLDPRYASPEYIHGEQVGPWSDIYQAGLHLFALVTGRLPFVGSTPAETGASCRAPVRFLL